MFNSLKSASDLLQNLEEVFLLCYVDSAVINKSKDSLAVTRQFNDDNARSSISFQEVIQRRFNSNIYAYNARYNGVQLTFQKYEQHRTRTTGDIVHSCMFTNHPLLNTIVFIHSSGELMATCSGPGRHSCLYSSFTIPLFLIHESQDFIYGAAQSSDQGD